MHFPSGELFGAAMRAYAVKNEAKPVDAAERNYRELQRGMAEMRRLRHFSTDALTALLPQR